VVAREQLEQLLATVGQAQRVLILPHNDPDPDAIAAAVALCYLLQSKLEVTCHIAYKGIIGRAENRALARYLGHPLNRLRRADFQADVPVALVDTQPGFGNNALSAGAAVAIVIDHHPWREETAAAIFADVRPDVGSVSTMLTQYLQAAGLPPTATIATALFYGIKTDTMGLARGAAAADTSAYFYLLPRIDVEALVKIERAQVPADYFRSLARTVEAARTYDGVIFSHVGSMSYPDLAAEMADLLLRLQGTQWVICTGLHKDMLLVSVRTRHSSGAHQLAHAVIGNEGVAGGHGMLAGGQITVGDEDPEQLVEQLRRRTLEYLKVPPDTEGKPLV
jgi:nanoRNase/pAp phosphatase (c-di-AMP/oligoRNAs hydrolase)